MGSAETGLRVALMTMATTPNTGTKYTYSADGSQPTHPALSGMSPNTEVTVNSADKDQVRVGWTDAAGTPREASVGRDVFDGSFTAKG